MAPTEVLEQVGKMSDEEFKQHVLGIMERELGVYGLARFLRVLREGGVWRLHPRPASVVGWGDGG